MVREEGIRRTGSFVIPQRFEELESEDDLAGQGVILDPYAARDARARSGFVSDELYFDGYDIGRDRMSRRGMYDQYGEEFDSDELDYRDQRGMAYQQAVRDKEEALIQSALARIARAREKGKTNVNLSQEEMEALERRRGQQPEPSPPLASPPPTPAKATKAIKGSSRSNSSTNLASQKARKRGGTGLFGSGSSSPAKSNSKAKVSRKPSDERALTYPPGNVPPGVMVPGPDGQPVYAPIGYYGPPSPEFVRSKSGGSRPGSRSASKHNRRDSTPPERADPYAQYPLRYYPPPPGLRPESSGSNRSLPDDVDWYPPPPRNRSASNARYAGYPADYHMPPALPAAQSRRNVSGPPDVQYSNLRRVPPSSSPLAQRPLPAHASQSDSSVPARRTSGLHREVDRSSTSSSSTSSGSDDQGVQVDILPDATGGQEYAITRTPIQAPQQMNEAEGRRRRKGGRK